MSLVSPVGVHISEDPWLSAIFGHGVFKIEHSGGETLDADKGGILSDLISQHMRRQAQAMYFTKVDTTDIDLARHLGATGLYVTDVNVTFSIDTKSLTSPPVFQGQSPCVVKEVLPHQYDEVLDIAATCFRYSRFHLDPMIPEAVADRIEREWVRSYLRRERGEHLLVASRASGPAGFLAVLASEVDGKKVRTIDLIGVSRPFQGQGIGQALMAHFIKHYQHRCDYLQIGTQVANLPAMRLIQKMGFCLVKSAYVLHMHVFH